MREPSLASPDRRASPLLRPEESASASIPLTLGLFGPPALGPGENADDWNALAALFVADTKPEGAIEEMLVRDVVDLVWEILRLRKMRMNMLRAYRSDGVLLLTRMLGSDSWDGVRRSPESMTESWASGDDDARTEISKRFEEAGLDDACVDGVAFARELGTIERIEQMIVNAEARRAVALQDVAQHREGLGVRARRASEAIDTEGVEVATPAPSAAPAP